MRPLDGLILEIPPMWERRDEWEEVYAAAEEGERPLIKTLGRLGELLREVDDARPTPLNLAWLSLWTKVFHCCDGGRGAYQRQSLYTARILQRVIFETSLHLGAIIQPLMESAGVDVTRRTGDLAENPSLANRRVRDRLTAYAAWCIHGDLEYWRCVRDGRNLQRIYDPGPGQELLEKYGDERELWEDLLGEVEIQSAEEAEAGLEKAREGVEAKIEKLEGWLDHPELKRWRDEIDRLRSTQDRPPTFFQLFEEDEDSIGRRLSSLGLQVAYLDWKRTSQAMHGETLEQSLNLIGPVAMPLVGAADEDMEHEMSVLGNTAQWSAMVLYMVRPSNVASA